MKVLSTSFSSWANEHELPAAELLSGLSLWKAGGLTNERPAQNLVQKWETSGSSSRMQREDGWSSLVTGSRIFSDSEWIIQGSSPPPSPAEAGARAH